MHWSGLNWHLVMMDLFVCKNVNIPCTTYIIMCMYVYR